MSAPSIVDALRTFATEIVRSAEFQAALRDVVGEMLASRPEAAELVSIATFARERELHAATVRQMAKDGRIEAVRVGKRLWRVRRDSPILPIRREERTKTGKALAIERAHQLVEKLGLEGGSR